MLATMYVRGVLVERTGDDRLMLVHRTQRVGSSDVGPRTRLFRALRTLEHKRPTNDRLYDICRSGETPTLPSCYSEHIISVMREGFLLIIGITDVVSHRLLYCEHHARFFQLVRTTPRFWLGD